MPRIIGPIMMGLKKPVHILQLDASVDEIVNMSAIAVIDAQKKQETAPLSMPLNRFNLLNFVTFEP